MGCTVFDGEEKMNYEFALKSARTYIEHAIIACPNGSPDIGKLKEVQSELNKIVAGVYRR